MDPTALVVVVGALAATSIVACAVVRRVPVGHCGVVTRKGRVVRSRPAGLVMVVPGVERVEMVALQPREINPLSVTALTRDGVEVRLVLSVRWCVADPSRAVRTVPDARAATGEAVDRALRDLVANLDLAHLARACESFLSRLPVTALPLMSPLGVALVGVDLVDAEVRVGPELLRLLA